MTQSGKAVFIDGLQVAARTSAFSFKATNTDIGTIARKLNVGAVLEGSVRRSAHTIRITAQLINAVTGFYLWSKTYDRDTGDVQPGGLRCVSARGEGVSLVPRHQRPSRRDCLVHRSDPLGSPLAFVARSLSFTGVAGEAETETTVQEYYAKAVVDARHAIELAPDLGPAHLALAFVLDNTLQFPQVITEYERALVRAPADVFPAIIDGLDIRGRSFPPIDALAADTTGMSKTYGRTIDGVLGYSFLKDQIVLIDYAAQQAAIFDRAVDARPKVGLCRRLTFYGSCPHRNSLIVFEGHPFDKSPSFTDRHQEERFFSDAFRRARRAQFVNGVIEWVVGEFKCSPMDPNAAFRTQIEVHLNRLLHVDMLRTHEPPRQAGADRNQRKIESATVLCRLARGEALADIDEITAVTGVAGEEPVKVRLEDGPTPPESFVAVAHAALRPMLGWGEHEFDSAADMMLPPIQFDGVRDPTRLQPRQEPKRHEEQRRTARLTGERHDAGAVEMIVMVM